MNVNGPEDNPKWTQINGENHTPTVESCHKCGNSITIWHCADGGCPWCARCGANAKDLREKRKNGTD